MVGRSILIGSLSGPYFAKRTAKTCVLEKYSKGNILAQNLFLVVVLVVKKNCSTRSTDKNVLCCQE